MNKVKKTVNFCNMCTFSLIPVKAELEHLNGLLNDLPVVTDRERQDAERDDKKAKECEEEVKKIEGELHRGRKAIDEAKNTIEERVENLVEMVDRRFGDMMASLDNSGSVLLHREEARTPQGRGKAKQKGNKDAPEVDFKGYGLHIMVKFANTRGQEMQRLSASVHSGGTWPKTAICIVL